MPSRSQLRDAAIQRRRIVILEKIYMPKFAREIDRAGVQASDDYQSGGMDRVEVGMQDHSANLQKLLSELYDDAAQSAERYSREKYGKRLPGRVEKKDAMQQAIDLLAQYWLSESFTMSKFIAETTLDTVRKTTVQAVSEGLGELAISARIREVQDGLSAGRARTIARTETHQAIMKSQNDIIESMDLPEYVREWNSGSDGRVRKAHRDANGQIRRVGNPFDVGGDKLEYPGARGGKPENVINCRCVVTESFDQDDIRRAV